MKKMFLMLLISLLPLTVFANPTWTLANMQEGDKNVIFNLYALDAEHVWALGSVDSGGNSQLVGLRSTNGSSFGSMSLPSPSSSNGMMMFLSIVFTDQDTGYLAGTEISLPFKGFGDDLSNSKVWKTTNGGMSWDVLAENLDGAVDKMSVSPAGDVFGVSGSTVYKITPSGVNSVEVSGLGDRSIHVIQMLDSSVGFIGGGTPDDSDEGLVAGNGFIMKTTDGGNSWTMVKENLSFNVTSLSFINETRGWVGGNDPDVAYINYTDDGGATWENQTLPQHPPIDVDFGIGGTQTVGPAAPDFLSSIKFFDCTRGVALGTACISNCEEDSEGSPSFLNIFMRTYDGGTTWEMDPDYESVMTGGQFMPEMKILAGMFNMSFPDPNNGYLAGQHLMILKYEAQNPEQLPDPGIPSCDGSGDDNNNNNDDNNNNNGDDTFSGSDSSDSGCSCASKNGSDGIFGVFLFGLFVVFKRRLFS